MTAGMVAPLRLSRGTMFAGDYRILRSIGHGGLGTVYEAEQLSAHRVRALKVLHPQFVEDEGIRARFEQEARVAAHIPSAHVVQVIASGVDEASGAPWMSMELLRGEDLEAAMTRRGGFPPREVLTLFRELCDALGQAHALGIVHRDLKPENIFMAASPSAGEAPTVKVLDFGIAKWVDDNRASQENSQLIGTPLWMAPEQAQRNTAIRPATDVWALGLLAFRLLTGHLYWKSAGPPPSVAALLSELLNEPLDPASVRAAHYGATGVVPPGFDGWFARCVVRDSTARFTDANHCLAALALVLGDRVTDPDDSEVGFAHTMQIDARPVRPSVGEAATMMAPTPVRSPALRPPDDLPIGDAATLLSGNPRRVDAAGTPLAPVRSPSQSAPLRVGPPQAPLRVGPPQASPGAPQRSGPQAATLPPPGSPRPTSSSLGVSQERELVVPLPSAPPLPERAARSPSMGLVLLGVVMGLMLLGAVVFLLRR